ncbi:protein of unknown function DUF974 [Echinococcus multilocularis]|uniref:Uncharacterized protein n=1 Tax=Echinococcus multilocularis TaxID=6211 RepID=U6I8U8_ECHMU|nr:protein of unknown function DUF974 [Echinococcus multilocularis]
MSSLLPDSLLLDEGEREVDVPMKFTKNFKFTVGKPFDFKPTQFPTSGLDIYVGAQIENLMPQPIIVERLVWEPGPLTKVTDLNSLVDWTRGSSAVKLQVLCTPLPANFR